MTSAFSTCFCQGFCRLSSWLFLLEMKKSFLVIFFTCLILGAWGHEHDHDHEDDHDTDLDDPELQYVTCGSVVTLQHFTSKFRLHSHDVKYGGGSGQLSVTGFKEQGDVNNYWIVREGYGAAPCEVGQAIPKGSTVRFKHQTTGSWLHSHLHKSPLSKEQEVSCYGDEGHSDTGDNWEVIFTAEYWTRAAKFRLKHKDTGKFLHTTESVKYKNPIPGQTEVCAVSRRGPDNVWAVGEGIYWEAILPEDNNDKDEL